MPQKKTKKKRVARWRMNLRKVTGAPLRPVRSQHSGNTPQPLPSAPPAPPAAAVTPPPLAPPLALPSAPPQPYASPMLRRRQRTIPGRWVSAARRDRERRERDRLLDNSGRKRKPSTRKKTPNRKKLSGGKKTRNRKKR